MSEQESKDSATKSINLVLIAISMLILGALGIVFVTQMELQPGWVWDDLNEIYPANIYSLESDDVTGDGINDILVYVDIQHEREEIANNTPQYGGVFLINGRTSAPFWSREFSTPVKKVFQIMDVDSDNIKDYFVDRATASPNWSYGEGQSHGSVDIIPNMNINQIISGVNGTNIPISTGNGISFTNRSIIDLVSLNDLFDQIPDLICLEADFHNVTQPPYNWSISTYFINGTKSNSIYVGSFELRYNMQSSIPALDLLEFEGQPQSNLLYIESNSIRLYNLSSSNFMNQTYNKPLFGDINNYEIIEDLNSDGISEILIFHRSGEILLINGINGDTIRSFFLSHEIDESIVSEVPNSGSDGTTYFLVSSSKYDSGTETNQAFIDIYSIDITSQSSVWSLVDNTDSSGSIASVLDVDLDGDNINEIVYYERVMPFGAMQPISRYRIYSFITGKVFGILNLEYNPERMTNIDDFDGNGRRDFLLNDDGRLVALSTKKPVGIWLSSEFTMGIPLFIALVAMLAGGVIILILKGRDLRVHRGRIRESLKKSKLTITVNVVVLILMTLCFILFLAQLNIFNNTLISNNQMTGLIVIFLSIIILWYAILPLTAAIYNQFAPNFAFLFIKLRNLFFKISRGYNHEIFVVDMKERKHLGTVGQIKRVILPLLLSIAIGFYIYSTFAPTLGYPQGFEQFGSTEFFQFMIGYMALSIFPMVLSYLLFSFFISGNFLLDDAGIVYYKESKKYRSPGDIEPISIWAQSMVKGIAGFSALITFGTFFLSVDFSGFFRFEPGNEFFLIFGILIVIVLFWGMPFLTSFSYVLLAGEIMEFSNDVNTRKLLRLMEKAGFNTTPRDLTNIYPPGLVKKDKVETSDKTKIEK